MSEKMYLVKETSLTFLLTKEHCLCIFRVRGDRMKRSTVLKITLISSVLIVSALIVYFLIYKAVLEDTGVYIGGTFGFFVLLAFIATGSKSKQQLNNELKYMSTTHDNHRPKIR